MIYVAMDDTDMPDTPGTGHLARAIAAVLRGTCTVRGVSRHQLLRDPRVPMTKNNSANVVHVAASSLDILALAEVVQAIIIRDAAVGSDPALCVAADPVVPDLVEFGCRVKTTLVTQDEAVACATHAGVFARRLGGDGGGIIGAVAAVGLAACGDDGRFVDIGTVRQLQAVASVAEILGAGVAAVRTTDGAAVAEGMVTGADRLRPEIIGYEPVLLVTAVSAGTWASVRREPNTAACVAAKP